MFDITEITAGEGKVIKVSPLCRSKTLKIRSTACVRVEVIHPYVSGDIDVAAAKKFNDFYSSVADGFVLWCEEKVSPKAREEYSRLSGMARYRFKPFSMRCEFVPKYTDTNKFFEVERHTEFKGILSGEERHFENSDTIKWRLPMCRMRK